MWILSYVCLGLLLIWFFGCIVTYRLGEKTLVDGMGAKSAEFIMLILYVIGIAAYVVSPNVGRGILVGILVFWFAVQFFCHWYYTIFGASEKKLRGYNECFQNTIRIFPQSDRRVIPDFYHMVLHILIAMNILLLCL